jgi:hypothetical protein
MVERHPAYAPIAEMETGASFFWNDTPAGGEILFREHFATADGRAILRAPLLESTLLAGRAATYSATDAWLDRERARLFGPANVERSLENGRASTSGRALAATSA